MSKANEQYAADMAEANRAFIETMFAVVSTRQTAVKLAENQWKYNRQFERQGKPVLSAREDRVLGLIREAARIACECRQYTTDPALVPHMQGIADTLGLAEKDLLT